MRYVRALFVSSVIGLGLSSAIAEPFHEVAPGLFQSALVRVDAKKRSVAFPAKVNMVEGALEYGIVTPAGSVHESLLVSEVDPVDLNAAFLLLGLKGRNIESVPRTGGGLNAKALAEAPELAGTPVRVFVHWEDHGTSMRVPFSEWILYKPEGRTARDGPWLFSGSYFLGNEFAAASEGAILCLVTNPAALLNNPRQGHRDDTGWGANARVIPAVGTAVTIEVEVVKVNSPQP